MAPAPRIAPFLLAALAAALGCSQEARPAPTDELIVLAASSTTEVFKELATAFEARRPGTRVRLAFAGSQALRLQLEHGAPGDVYASANAEHVNALMDKGLVSDVEGFATNELAVVVSESGTAPITSFADLPRAERIVVGAPSVPVGAYTRTLLENVSSEMDPELATQLRDRIVSKENNVRLVRAKVELGEADAAIVYLTDALSAEGARIVRVPDEVNVRAQYYAGRVTSSSQPTIANEWIAFLSSDEARGILRRHGFRVD